MDVKTNYEEYLEKYCKSYNVTPEVASTHKLVQLVKSYYEENNV